MQKQILKYLVFLAIFLIVPSFAKAAPSISSAPATISDEQSISISGSGFGIKTTATPFYFNDLENETIGQIPSDQISNTSRTGIVGQDKARGNRSLEFDYCADTYRIAWEIGQELLPGYVVTYNSLSYVVLNNIASSLTTPDLDSANYQANAPIYCPEVPIQSAGSDWRRNAVDLGSSQDKVYVSTWVYLDKQGTTSRKWQWKNFRLISNPDLYSHGGNDTMVSYETWYNDNYAGDGYIGWAGSGNPSVTYGPISNAYNGGATQDAFLFGTWQRVEFFVQQSSASGIADGKVYFNRLGSSSPMTNVSDVITFVDNNTKPRYVDLSNGIESNFTGLVKMNAYMDNIYIDKTQARIEICDSSTWSTRTHCEIQIPTAWDGSSPTNSITASVNQGAFGNGTDAYLYVVDENGVASAGQQIKFSGIADTTAPSAPTGLGVI